jgi:phosphoglycolate phosphatase
MIKLVIFDWNGTLLADTTAVLEATNRELDAVYDHAPIALPVLQRHFDVPITDFFRNLGISHEVIKARASKGAEVFHAFYEPQASRTHTRRGARHVLEALAAMGIDRVILSNHTTEGISAQLRRLKLGHHFEAVLANDSIHGALRNGKQERLAFYLRASAIRPADAVIIGDTAEEVRIGRQLGTKTVCITGGNASTDRLRAANPDAIIHSLLSLPRILELI